jgi:penicillin-binding protein 1A
MMQGVMDIGTGRSMRGKFGINGQMGGKTGTTNDNTDGWFIGYTPQLLAGAWVGCDDPFLKIRWTYGGNEMAMPQWAYFMQKVYADKKLGIDPNATFVKPAELDNNPIYADSRFGEIVRSGQGSDFTEDLGNGDESDYMNDELAPVESEFKDMNSQTTPPVKQSTDTSKKLPKADDKKDVKAIIPPAGKGDDKNKKVPPTKPKVENDY